MDRKELIEFLFINQDLKYKEFHHKITGDNAIIGIKTPILKKIAKNIAKINYKDIFKLENEFYEEKLIFGLVIGYSKIEFDQKLSLLDSYTNIIDNWALCDLTISNLKDFKNNQEKGFKKCLEYINSNKRWKIRVGIVILLNYYVNKNYINKIIKIIPKIKNEDYYVKMAVAWLISVCYINYDDKILTLLEEIDDFTRKKAISKINDSFRINKNSKDKLNIFYKK